MAKKSVPNSTYLETLNNLEKKVLEHQKNVNAFAECCDKLEEKVNRWNQDFKEAMLKLQELEDVKAKLKDVFINQ